jgi:hypothetical protein
MTYAHSPTCRESPEWLVEGSDTTFVIAGFGKFGRLALDRLKNSFPQSRIIVLEQGAGLSGWKPPPRVRTIAGDAVSLLSGSSLFCPEYLIIPMVPFNLAASYVLSMHPDSQKIVIPEDMMALLPNPLRVDVSNVVCSRADFVCPDDCPEGELCTVTGKPREPLYDLLDRIEVDGFKILVQKSSQILPGVGGYRLADLHELARQVGKGRSIVATSCKCHGILTAIMK